jgi:voltage-gated potassium channel
MTTAAVTFLRGRFTGLTVAVLALSLTLSVLAQRELREVVVALAFSVLLLFAIWSAGRRLRAAMLALAVPTLISHWTIHLGRSPLPPSVGFAFTSGFLALLTLVIMVAVFRDQAVTADTIVGAVCTYVLIGVTWGTVYSLLVLASPDSLAISPALAHAAGWAAPTSPFTPLLQYYSFTTLATLGYGDISPLSPGARVLSVLEGMTGQLYLAVLVARLVGIHTARGFRQ